MTVPSIVARVLAVALVVAGCASPAGAATAAPLGDVSGPHLRVVTHDLGSVPGFDRFSYQTGKVRGLPPSAAARADRVVEATVQRAVDTARQPSGSPCSGGAERCGYFLQHLREHPCITGYVCLAQQVGLLPQGANDGQDWVDTIALHSGTGRVAHLSEVVRPTQRAAFVTAVNSGIQRVLAAGGLVDDPYWATPVTLDDVHAWLPGPSGIHVWFAKFAVAPGSYGVVHVRVPWAAITGS